MLRRHSNHRTSSSHNRNCSSTTTSLHHPVWTRPSVKQKSKTNSRDSIFKVIVAIEVIFLVIIWSCYVYSEHLHFASIRWRRQKIAVIPRSTNTNAAYNNVSKDDKEQDNKDDNNVPLWAQQLRDESREKHKREQEQRRQLAKIGVIREIPNEFKGPTLIIGGSDGSGTRAFVRYMLKLGVPMRIDDKESLDVHGAVMFEGQGWPPLAKSILNVTHSANYELSNLPSETQTTVVQELQRLKYALDAWQLKLEQRFFIRQHLNKTTPRASNAAVGFKAPVTMLLLPLIKEVFGKVKYLHIVRDGRDVALSTNKSPVQKFYQSMYADANERMKMYLNDSYPVLAMHLWNDWNTQALEWQQAHSSTDSDFDSLVMRSEDLVDPGRKFETLARLAAFVSSPKTLEEICCLSREEEVDMGQSLVSNEVAAGDYEKDQHLGRGKVRVAFPGSLRRHRYDSKGQEVEENHKRFGLHMYHDFFHGGFESGHLEDKVRKSKEEEELFERPREQDNHRHLLESTDATQIFSRYGKWREILKDNPRLSALLHQAGAKGLSTFGYEPEFSFMDPRTSPTKGFVCDEKVLCKE